MLIVEKLGAQLGEMSFMIQGEEGEAIEFRIPQHWGMSLVQGLHFLQKGFKGACFGQGNQALIGSVREKGFHANESSYLRECVIDIWLISRSVPEFDNFCVNVAGLLSLCAIPADLVGFVPEGMRDVDYYDTLVRYLFNARIPYVERFLMESSCLLPIFRTISPTTRSVNFSPSSETCSIFETFSGTTDPHSVVSRLEYASPVWW